jgi:predicted DNA-binding transcriptional regulator AlpA
MRINQLSEYIHRSKGAIRNLVLRRTIPYRKPAGRLIFLKEEIDQWVQMAPGKSLEEIKNDLCEKETLRNTHAKSSIKFN